jgi:hypothetical protein
MNIKKAVSGGRLACAATLALASVSCGDMAREGQASSYLVITELVAASGAEPTELGATLFSDVETVVEEVASVFADNARVTFRVNMKDPGFPGAVNLPSAVNAITLERYHVKYIRADGRNTPGVDVPYPFDGALTFTVVSEQSQSFELVRHVAKLEAPLAALNRNRVIILTIAEITFYGRDQAGRAVSANAKISIEFGNFGDPE